MKLVDFPISFVFTYACLYFFTEAFNIHLDMNDLQSLIKFNVNQTGFYRVNYPDFVWQRFASHLDDTGPSAVSNFIRHS